MAEISEIVQIGREPCMPPANRRVVVIGGGVAGLTAAYCLKKRGITPEYQERWSERLMESQQAGTKPESVVKVPEAISTAIEKLA